ILLPDRHKVPASVRISPAVLGGVPGEWVEGPKPGGITLLYLHGGGYFGCSAETHRAITSTLALQGFRVYAPDYRLAPENRFPAAIDDAVAVYHALLSASHAPKSIGVSGESAGVGFALALILLLLYSDAAIPMA